MKFTKKSWRFIKTKAGIIIVVILVLSAIFLIFKKNDSDQNIFTLTSDNLAATGITVGGTVVAQNEVDLSFEVSGRVSRVLKKAGDRVTQGETIASLDTGIVSANILKAQADLDAENAKLNEYKKQEGSGSTEVETKKSQLIREMHNAYIVSDDSVKNKTDQFFNDPNARFPKIFPLTDSSDSRDKISVQRYQIGLLLKKWQVESNLLTSDTYSDEYVASTKSNIAQVQTYINAVASVVNQFEADRENPQSIIDKYKSDTSVARTNLNNTLTDFINAQEALRSTTSQIPYQEARVKSARATLQNYQAELRKSLISAPFTGLITKQGAKVGMSASGDQPLVSMISDSNYGLDIYVPEIYISQIKIGDKAKVTLTSYGSTEEFDASVTYIDPAASQRDGVASYKVELVFDKNDDRIKSGMTGDVEIITEIVNPSFWVPVESITDQGGASYVKVKSGETVELRKVEIGERNLTEAEIKTGLIVGDQLIIPTQK